jgi:CBS domain-containing protein
MEVGTIMQREVVTVGGDATIAEVAKVIHERGVGSVLVEEGGRVEGILTERDVVACVARGMDVHSVKAKDIEKHDLVYASPRTSLEEAARMMVARGIRHLPVIEGNQLVGIVSMRDLTRWSVTELSTDVGELPHIELAQKVLLLSHGPDPSSSSRPGPSSSSG